MPLGTRSHSSPSSSECLLCLSNAELLPGLTEEKYSLVLAGLRRKEWGHRHKHTSLGTADVPTLHPAQLRVLENHSPHCGGSKSEAHFPEGLTGHHGGLAGGRGTSVLDGGCLGFLTSPMLRDSASEFGSHNTKDLIMALSPPPMCG